MKHGVITRAKPFVAITQGYTPEDAIMRYRLAPCLDTTEISTIKSGMVVSLVLDSGAYKWRRGFVAGAVPHIAMYDGVDPLYTASGKLPAIPLSGQFTLKTGYFNEAAAASFVPGVAISAYAFNDGTDANKGRLKIAASGETIVARGVSQGADGTSTASTDQAYAGLTVSGVDNASMVEVESAFTGLLLP